MRKEKPVRRKLSFGSVFMLGLLAVVLCGSALVLGRLSSGASVDLSRLSMNVLDLQESSSRTAETEPAVIVRPEQAAPPASSAATTQPAEAEASVSRPNAYTLTVGGSIALTGEVRKNSWNPDAKITDYADVMMLLARHVNADVNCVFLENVLSDRLKANDNVAPTAAAAILKEAGFDMAACGFAQAYAGGRTGTEETVDALVDQGIRPLGINGAGGTFLAGGIRTAFLQYTDTVPAKTRKTMARDGAEDLIPPAEVSRIREDIAAARQQGAEAVIVLLNWGKTGKDPDKAQKELADGIAQAGADLIIGCGNHVPQTAEYLTGENGKNVLCVWSLGSLLCGDRGNIKRISGYLLHVTVRSDGQGGVDLVRPEYTPVYAWKYRQDGRYYYRCIASDNESPDGMDNEQRKNMSKSAETVAAVLDGSPLNARR